MALNKELQFHNHDLHHRPRSRDCFPIVIAFKITCPQILLPLHFSPTQNITNQMRTGWLQIEPHLFLSFSNTHTQTTGLSFDVTSFRIKWNGTGSPRFPSSFLLLQFSIIQMGQAGKQKRVCARRNKGMKSEPYWMGVWNYAACILRSGTCDDSRYVTGEWFPYFHS